MDDGIHSDTSEGLSVWGSPDFLVGPEWACFKPSARRCHNLGSGWRSRWGPRGNQPRRPPALKTNDAGKNSGPPKSSNQETRKENQGGDRKSHPSSCVTNSFEVWTILCESVHKDSGQTGKGTRAEAFSGSSPLTALQLPRGASRCGRFLLPLRQSVLTRGARTENSATLRKWSTEDQRVEQGHPRGRKNAERIKLVDLLSLPNPVPWHWEFLVGGGHRDPRPLPEGTVLCTPERNYQPRGRQTCEEKAARLLNCQTCKNTTRCCKAKPCSQSQTANASSCFRP